MRFAIRFSANRDQASSGGPSDDPLFDLFSGGSAKHFEPIDDDEDDALPQTEMPQAVENGNLAPTDTRSQELESESVRHRDPGPSTRQQRPPRGRSQGRHTKPDKAVQTPAPPQKSSAKVSHWDSLAASLGLEVDQPQHDSIAEDDETAAAETVDPGYAAPEAGDPGDDAWRHSVAELFQMDPSEIPGRAEEKPVSSETDTTDELADDDETFVSDFDADFVEFEVRDLAPNQERDPVVERPRRSPPRSESPPGDRRDSQRERRPERGSDSRRDRSSRPPRREPAAPRARQPDGLAAEPSESRRGSQPQRNKSESRPARSSAPASADLLHDDGDFVETSGDDQAKRVTSWAEAIDVMIERNLSTRRKSGPSNSGGRRPRNNDRRR